MFFASPKLLDLKFLLLFNFLYIYLLKRNILQIFKDSLDIKNVFNKGLYQFKYNCFQLFLTDSVT